MARNLHAQYSHSFPKVSQEVTNTAVVQAAALEGGRLAQLFCTSEPPKEFTDMSEQELDAVLASDDHALDQFLVDIEGCINHFEPKHHRVTRNGQEIPSDFGTGIIKLYDEHTDMDDDFKLSDIYDPFDEYDYDIYKLGQARGCIVDGVDIELLFDRQGVFHDVLTAKLIIAKQVAHNTQPPTDPVDLLTNHGPMRLRDKELDIHEGDHNAGAKPQEITRKARRSARRLLDQLHGN